jgi:hypothetical protein
MRVEEPSGTNKLFFCLPDIVSDIMFYSFEQKESFYALCVISV